MRAALFVAPAYPLLAIVSSTVLMVTSSTLHLLVRLHWLVDLASLHAPFWYVHLHARRNFLASVSHGMTEHYATACETTLPRHQQDVRTEEEDTREHMRRQRLLRFWRR